jgi:hypothetical protein
LILSRDLDSLLQDRENEAQGLIAVCVHGK